MRNEDIFQDREQGMTFSDISYKYGISSSRAIQICKEVKKQKAYKDDELYIFCNSNKQIYLALKRCGINSKEELIKYSNDNNQSPRRIGDETYRTLIARAKGN